MAKDDHELASLERELTILTERIAQKKNAAREQVKREIQELARPHGLVVTFATAKTEDKKDDGRGTPKYKHPTDGRLTWTGKGRKPKWLEEALSGDHQLTDFLISPASG